MKNKSLWGKTKELESRETQQICDKNVLWLTLTIFREGGYRVKKLALVIMVLHDLIYVTLNVRFIVSFEHGNM